MRRGSRVDVLLIQAEESIEQMEIRKDSGKVLSKIVQIAGGDRLSVEDDFSAILSIQTGQKLRQRRLAASISARKEYHFARRKLEVHRTKDELAVFVFARIRKLKVADFQRFPVCAGRQFGCVL